MARKQAESSERSFGINEAGIGGELLKAAVKLSWTSKRTQTTNREVSYLGCDHKAAEHDLITIARRLAAGYTLSIGSWQWITHAVRGAAPLPVRLKIVFVFDEPDRLEEFTAPSTSRSSSQ